MLSILVVLSAGGASRSPEASRPAVEVLVSRGLEEALEKLGRNRRIDAILLAAEEENPRIEAAIREDEPAPPQVFRASSGRALEDELDRVIETLES